MWLQKHVPNYIYKQNSYNQKSKHGELETHSSILKRSLARHCITSNLILPISNLRVTLDNVSYYIMRSGTCCDLSEPALCKTAAVPLLWVPGKSSFWDARQVYHLFGTVESGWGTD